MGECQSFITWETLYQPFCLIWRPKEALLTKNMDNIYKTEKAKKKKKIDSPLEPQERNSPAKTSVWTQ